MSVLLSDIELIDNVLEVVLHCAEFSTFEVVVNGKCKVHLSQTHCSEEMEKFTWSTSLASV